MEATTVEDGAVKMLEDRTPAGRGKGFAQIPSDKQFPIRCVRGFVIGMAMTATGLIGIRADGAADGAGSGSEKTSDWVTLLTTEPAGEFPRMPPCQLEYTLSWNGLINAGKVKVTIQGKDSEHSNRFVGEAKGRSTGLAGKLWPYRFLFESVLDEESLRPVEFRSVEKEKDETTTTQNLYRADQVTSVEVTSEDGRETGRRTREFPMGAVQDLFSTILYARSLPLDHGSEITMVTHPFHSAYLIRFKVEGRGTYKGPLGEQRAIRMSIGLRKISKDLELKEYGKLKKAEVLVSDDEHRLPLEIRSEVFIGRVQAVLTKRRLGEVSAGESNSE